MARKSRQLLCVYLINAFSFSGKIVTLLEFQSFLPSFLSLPPAKWQLGKQPQIGNGYLVNNRCQTSASTGTQWN
jgi:hypothetical protein